MLVVIPPVVDLVREREEEVLEVAVLAERVLEDALADATKKGVGALLEVGLRPAVSGVTVLADAGAGLPATVVEVHRQLLWSRVGT